MFDIGRVRTAKFKSQCDLIFINPDSRHRALRSRTTSCMELNVLYECLDTFRRVHDLHARFERKGQLITILRNADWRCGRVAR